MRRKSRSHAFTLLELLVVLAILAVVTTLAVRTLDRVEDQKRYEAALQGLEDLSDAIVGSSRDRSAGGDATLSGFVADMGRLPRTNLAETGVDVEMRELWQDPGSLFDVRPAIGDGIHPDDQDPNVMVAGGWRGPYVRLPIGATTLLDGWGNAMTSPTVPGGLDFVRLLDGSNQPITAAGQEVRMIRILGADGKSNPLDTGYDRDRGISFSVVNPGPLFVNSEVRAGLAGNVEVRDGSSPADPDPVGSPNPRTVIVRIFGPDLSNPSGVGVVRSVAIPFTSNPVSFTIPITAGAMLGPRVVRAYLQPPGSAGTVDALKRSGVRHATLRGGANLMDLVIDR